MSNSSSPLPEDILSPELRKALVEIGAMIPTTAAEVALAERHLDLQVSESQIDASFSEIQELVKSRSQPKPAVRYKTGAVAATGLALAARKGAQIDEATRAKIEADINQANQNKLNE